MYNKLEYIFRYSVNRGTQTGQKIFIVSRKYYKMLPTFWRTEKIGDFGCNLELNFFK